jgi:competence protein ComEA
MDSTLLERLLLLLRRNSLILLFCFLGLIFLGYGLRQTFLSEKDNGIVFESRTQKAETASITAFFQTIVVDVAGAVNKPGVYSLKSESRVRDAIVAAGGFHKQADQEWIAKQMNLASKISDGAKIYVPFLGEDRTTGAESKVEASGGLVNINSASLSQLEALPGIGPVTAQRIIESRPYASIDELLSKKIVGNSTFEKIKGSISIY